MATDTALAIEAIEQAFATEVGALYKVLKSKLTAQHLSAPDEQDAIGLFAAGLRLNLRTKDTALTAIAAALPAA